MVTATPSERRTTRAFALFEYGYRPFFLLAGLHGAVLVPVWVAAVFGWLALPVEMEVSWLLQSETRTRSISRADVLTTALATDIGPQQARAQ